MAIFAQAWTFEYFGPSKFAKVENIFWVQLMQYLYIHVPIFENERFVTTFCRGAGMRYFEYGMVTEFFFTHKNYEFEVPYVHLENLIF